MTDFDDVLKLASLPSRTVWLCLDGATLEEIENLQRELEQTPKATSVADGRRRELTEALAAAQQRMGESTVAFRLRAMPVRGEGGWPAFMLTRPLRGEKEPDEAYEVRAFPWYAELVSRTCIDPVMSLDQVTELVDLLSGAGWNELAGTAMNLNARKVDVPNFDAASAPTRDSEPE